MANRPIAHGVVLLNPAGVEYTAAGDSTPALKAATIADAVDVTLTAATATAILAADATRREAIIVADPANTANIRIGLLATVAVDHGAVLQPGASITLTTTAAIAGFATPAGQKVSIALIKD